MRFAGLLAAAALALAGSAWAAPQPGYSVASDYTPSAGPISSGAAGTSPNAGGWVDKHGSVWSVNSSNQLISSTTTVGVSASELVAPTPTTSSIQTGAQVKFVASTPTSAGVQTIDILLRYSNPGSSTTAYNVAITQQASNVAWLFNLRGYVNGVQGTNVNSLAYTALTPGTTYCFQAYATQLNATTTQINGYLYQSDCSTLIQNFLITDTTAALQNLSGGVAAWDYAIYGATPFTELTSFVPTPAPSRTWAVANDFIPAASAVAAGSPPGPFAPYGWIDPNGAIWSANASGKLAPTGEPGSPPSAWQGFDLERPSVEASVDNQLDVRVPLPVSTGPQLGFNLRGVRTGSTVAAYVVIVNTTGQVNFYVVNGATYTQIGSFLIPGLTAGTDYVFRPSVIQTNATTSALSMAVYDSTGVTLQGRASLSDATPAMQNVAGVPAVYQIAGSGAPTAPLDELKTYTDAGAATGLTISGPSNGSIGVATGPFYVTANGSVSSSTPITFSDGAQSGTFTATTLAPGSSTGYFTYSAASVGAKSLTAAAAGLTTSPAFSYVPNVFVPVTSAAFEFGPMMWTGDSATCPGSQPYRCGSLYRQSSQPGSWVDFVFTAGASPTAVLNLANGNANNGLQIYVNGVRMTATITTASNVNITGLIANASNTIHVVRQLSQNNVSGKWLYNGPDQVQVTGMQIDGASTPGIAPALSWGPLFIGDSITQGYEAGGVASTDAYINSYTFLMAQGLKASGKDIGVKACGGLGWIIAGDGGSFPAFYYTSGGTYNASLSSWNMINSQTSALDANGHFSAYGGVGQEPSEVVINLITNEADNSASISDTENSIVQGLAAVRGALPPTTPIILLMPFGLEAQTNYYGLNLTPYAPVLRTAFAMYQAAHPDPKTTLVDYGLSFANVMQSGGYVNPDLLHPNANGHAIAAAALAQSALQALAQPAATPQFHRTFH